MKKIRYVFTNNFNKNQQINYIRRYVIFHKHKDSNNTIKWNNKNRNRRQKYKHSYPNTYGIYLPAKDGYARVKVCGKYLRWLLSFGKPKYGKIIKQIFKNRNSLTDIQYESKNKGYINKNKWEQRFESWAISHKQLYKSHYPLKNEIYFELENGVELDEWTVYNQFIQFDQPESYKKYLKPLKNITAYYSWKKNNKTKSNLDILHPFPNFRYFKQIIKKKYAIKYKRPGNDKCNDCQTLRLLLAKAKDEETKNKIKTCQKIHQTDACWKYQFITHRKKYAENSFKDIEIKRTPKTKNSKVYPNTFAFYEVDPDICYAEIETRENLNYYNSKIQVKVLNCIQYPSDIHGHRKVFMWSDMVGCKTATEIIQCVNQLFYEHNFGAERAFFNCDGAIKTYDLLKYFFCCCHPTNPDQCFKAIIAGTPEVGHTRLESDGISATSRKIYRKKETFKSCKERVDYLNSNSNLEVIQVKQFYQLPKIFEQIFKPTASWVDQCNPPNKCNIKHDPGITYEFGQSLVWNKNSNKYEWVSHPDEMWIRHSKDFKEEFRKIKVLKPLFENKNNIKLIKLQKIPIEPPSITRVKLEETLKIIKFFGEAEELVKYYVKENMCITNDVKKSTYKNPPTPSNYIVVKMERRVQMEDKLQGKNVELTPYEKKSNKGKRNKCLAPKLFNINVNSDWEMPQLITELQAHDLEIEGTKKDLLQISIDHYNLGHL